MSNVVGDKPKEKIDGLTFIPVPDFTNKNGSLTSAPENAYFDRFNRPDVPEQFERMASDFFFDGGDIPQFQPDVDRKLAVSALNAWLSSWAPPHESKISTVGYALWVWSTPKEQRA